MKKRLTLLAIFFSSSFVSVQISVFTGNSKNGSNTTAPEGITSKNSVGVVETSKRMYWKSRVNYPFQFATDFILIQKIFNTQKELLQTQIF